MHIHQMKAKGHGVQMLYVPSIFEYHTPKMSNYKSMVALYVPSIFEYHTPGWVEYRNHSALYVPSIFEYHTPRIA